MDRKVPRGGVRPPDRARRVLGSRPPRLAPAVRPRAGRPAGPAGPGPGLRRAAGYAWRLLLVGAAVYALSVLLGRLQLLAVAVFVALVFTAVLRPLVDLVGRVLPRSLAVLVSLVTAIVAVAGLLVLVGEVVAAEADELGREVRGGLDRIERWLHGPPFHVDAAALTDLQGKLSSFVSGHRGWLVSTAVSSAGRVVEAVTALALALFCSVFFLHSGERMWDWAQRQLGPRAGPTWDRVGRTAWRTFAGYTRGLLLVAGTNAVLVGIALFVLQVPLALPLMVLEFFAAFIPLIGSPIALAVASVVALATRGPVIALIVLGLIVVIGQIEGHLLHPLVMSWAVRIHPVAIALSVAAGTLLAGVVGAAVAVPLVSVAWAVVQELRRPARRRGRTEERAPDPHR